MVEIVSERLGSTIPDTIFFFGTIGQVAWVTGATVDVGIGLVGRI